MLPLSLPLPLTVIPFALNSLILHFSHETNLLVALQGTGCNREGRCFTAELQRGQLFFTGLLRVKYSPVEAAKVMPEAWPLPGLLTSPQALRSHLTSEPAALRCQSRGKRGKALLFLRFIGEIWTKCWRCAVLERWAYSSVSWSEKSHSSWATWTDLTCF